MKHFSNAALLLSCFAGSTQASVVPSSSAYSVGIAAGAVPAKLAMLVWAPLLALTFGISIWMVILAIKDRQPQRAQPKSQSEEYATAEVIEELRRAA